MQGSKLTQLRSASLGLVEALHAEDRAGLVEFTDLVRQRMPLSRDRDAMRRALDIAPEPGDTPLVDATQAALVLAASGDGRALVILFSDGADTASFLRTAAVLDTARRLDVVVYAVTTQATPKTGFLPDLVRLAGGEVAGVDSPSGLREAFQDILTRFRHRYLLSYEPTGVPDAGWHDVTVRVRDRRMEVRARPGYWK